MPALEQQDSKSTVMGVGATAVILDSSFAPGKTLPSSCSLDELETETGSSIETEPLISSSGSEQGADDECLMQATPNLQATQKQDHCSGASPSQTAAALLQLRALGRAREIMDASAADDRQPCWLASSVSGYTIVQPMQQEFAPTHISAVTCQVPFLPGSTQGSPPAPPPGLPVPSVGNLEHSQQGGEVMGQSGEPQIENSPKNLVPSAISDASPSLTCKRLSATSARVTWVVDAKKFMSKDKMLVSPAFDLPMDRPMPFRMMVQPTVMPGRGVGGFDKARGRGIVQLKCHGDLGDQLKHDTLNFKLSVGKANWRGPVSHDFADASVAGLPARCSDWNFRAAAGASPTVAISLEVEYE